MNLQSCAKATACIGDMIMDDRALVCFLQSPCHEIGGEAVDQIDIPSSHPGRTELFVESFRCK